MHTTTGAYAIHQEHGEELASNVGNEFDFAEVRIFCSNFWAGFFSGCREYHGLVFETFPSYEVRSIGRTVETFSRNSDRSFGLTFSRYLAAGEEEILGQLLVSIYNPALAPHNRVNLKSNFILG